MYIYIYIYIERKTDRKMFGRTSNFYISLWLLNYKNFRCRTKVAVFELRDSKEEGNAGNYLANDKA